MGRERQVKKKRREHSDKSSMESSPALSFWIVAFLDLLGYRSVLAKFDVFPLPEESSAQQAVISAFARVVKLRRRLSRVGGPPVLAESMTLLGWER